MRNPILNNITTALPSKPRLSIQSCTGHVSQIRNHVKMWPWRALKNRPECYLDATKTPYTDRFNMNEFVVGKKKKPWMIVIPKEKDNRFNAFKWNDAYRSDPAEAKQIASDHLKRMQQSIRDRGHARETVPYDPPMNVKEQVIELYKSIHLEYSSDSGSAMKDDDILATDLEHNRHLKFNLLRKCVLAFKHDLPSNILNDISTINDVVDYFATPVRGINPYAALLRQDDRLPPNLTLIPEPLRFDVENDTRFGGISALPGIVSKMHGIRAQRQYPTLNQKEFQWPDI